jgi:hypothetical protein
MGQERRDESVGCLPILSLLLMQPGPGRQGVQCCDLGLGHGPVILHISGDKIESFVIQQRLKEKMADAN